MAYLHVEYWNLPELKDKEIKVSISFNKEKTNWATHEPKKIGYQATLIPIKRTKFDDCVMEEFSAFSGFHDCLLEVERQSSKRLEAAKKQLAANKEKYLDYFRNI